ANFKRSKRDRKGKGGDVMSLQHIFSRTLSEWMKGTGPERDIALSSRVRVARNVAGIPFPAIATDEQAAQVCRLAQEVLKKEPAALAGVEYSSLADVPVLDRQLLVERHLISPQHAQDVRHKAVLIRDDEAVSVMVNEEDHFRIQALFPGLQPEAALELCNQ